MNDYRTRIDEILKLNNFLIKLKSSPNKNREKINEIKRKLKQLVSSVLSSK